MAWTLFGVAAAFVVFGIALSLQRWGNGSIAPRRVLNQSSLVPPAVAFSVVGLVVVRRRPDHAAGWLMLGIGLIWSLGVGPSTPKGTTLEWITAGFWIPPFGVMGTHLLLRLPNGRLPSERWRVLSRLSTSAMTITMFGFLFDPSLKGNPIANRQVALFGLFGLILLAGCIVASIVSLFVRRRRADAVMQHVRDAWQDVVGSVRSAELSPKVGEHLVRRRPLAVHDSVGEPPRPREHRLDPDRHECRCDERQRGRRPRPDGGAHDADDQDVHGRKEH
ncbi:MAG: hypothetical protein ACXVPX_01380, partial [Actinomycetota bacterium]